MTEAQEQWARCKPWIEDALKYAGGMYDIEDVEKEIADGTMIFLPCDHSAYIFEFINYPRGKALNVFAGGGEKGKTLREYMTRIDPYFVALAKAQGCRWVTHFTRLSGERIGKSLGYRKQTTFMVKEISA